MLLRVAAVVSVAVPGGIDEGSLSVWYFIKFCKVGDVFDYDSFVFVDGCYSD